MVAPLSLCELRVVGGSGGGDGGESGGRIWPERSQGQS